MERDRALRLIAEGKTGEAIDCLLSFMQRNYYSNKTEELSEEYLEVILLSNQFRRTETAYRRNIIKYDDYSMSVNKITHSFLEFIKSRKAA
jgi:hypothetical protein